MKQQKLNSTAPNTENFALQDSQIEAIRKKWNAFLDKTEDRVTTLRDKCADYLTKWSFADLRRNWWKQVAYRTAQVAMTSGLLLTLNSGDAQAQNPVPACDAVDYLKGFNQVPSATFAQDIYIGSLEYGSPTLGDIDGDGDLDMFVGVKYGAGIYFFENTAGPGNDPVFNTTPTVNPFGIYFSGAPTFYLDNAGVPSAYGGPGQAISPDLVDIDGDGDLDLFAGEKYGYTLFFENTGTATAPDFSSGFTTTPFGIDRTYTTSSFYGYVYANAAPEFGDIDGDGDLDVLIGTQTGGIYLLENTGDANNPAFAAPVLAFPDFGIDGLRTEPAFVDWDGDGDLDVVTGISYPYTGNLFYENIGTPTAPSFSYAGFNEFGVASTTNGGYPNNSPAFADLDGDGDMDLVLGAQDYTEVKENQGSAQFPNFSPTPFGLVNTDGYLAPALGDLDGDGDLDMVVGTEFDGFYFHRNVGTPTSPAFAYAEQAAFGLEGTDYVGNFNDHGDLVDIDGDGDLDLFVGLYSISEVYFDENIGTPTTPDFSGPTTYGVFGIASLPGGGGEYAPEFVDIDGDGDYDLFVGTGYGDFYFSENTGTATAPDFSSGWQANPFGLTADPYGNSVPAFVDVDNDGDLDLVNGSNSDYLKVFENTGTATAPAFAAPVRPAPDLGNLFTDTYDYQLAPEAGDLNGDTFDDVFVGVDNKYDPAFAFFQTDAIVDGSTSVMTTANAGEDGTQGTFRITFSDETPLPTTISFAVSAEDEAAFTLSGGANVTNFDEANRTITIPAGVTFAEVHVDAIPQPNTDEAQLTFILLNESTGIFCPQQGAVSAQMTIADVVDNSLRATGGNRLVELNWAGLECEGGIQSSQIYVGTSPNSQQLYTTVEGSAVETTVTGLTNGLAYYFKVVATCNDGSTAETAVVRATPSLVSSTEEESLDQFMQVYPNPNNGTFSVQLDRSLNGNADLQVVSMTGQVVHRQAFTAQGASLDLSGLAAGTYIVQLNTEEGSFQKRVVVLGK